MEQSRAELSRSRARAALANLDLQRAELLFRQKVIPKDQFERVRTNREVTEAPSALVAKRQAEFNLSNTRILAPANGCVTRKAVEIGNWIQPDQRVHEPGRQHHGQRVWIHPRSIEPDRQDDIDRYADHCRPDAKD